ncbi:thioredoxin-like protein [Aspergillus ambiguus]|uniref:DsbA family oxidoreductase n=1 Tax=Aspergillus ambiguus TaxID=176160 RepID=UPI003CCDDA82
MMKGERRLIWMTRRMDTIFKPGSRGFATLVQNLGRRHQDLTYYRHSSNEFLPKLRLTMPVIPILIISDPICPWCYIGYRTLQRAITIYQKTYPGGSRDQITITWKPYFIDQDPPECPELVNDRMLRRMQDPRQVAAAQSRLQRAAITMGIQLKFGGYIGSSRQAHRLLHIVGEEKGCESQCQLAEKLFHAQFEREEDVSEREVLLSAAVQAGVELEQAQTWLDDENRGLVDMERVQRDMRAQGTIHGVPHFVIGDRHLEGAMDMEELMEALIAAKERSVSDAM